MKKHSFARDRVIRLRRGQAIRLVCGIPIFTRRIALHPGEFVVATCNDSPNVIIVGCQSFNRRIRVHLFPGQQLIVSCHR